MAQDTADYEQSEEIAIAGGKRALERAPWLRNRAVHAGKFFCEFRRNPVHPGYLAVHTVDGVGTKLFLSAWANNYRKQGIDGLAMSANDLAPAIHVYPADVTLYFAMQTPVEEQHMEEIMHGIVDGLERLRIPNAPFDINTGKIETASLDEMISLGVQGKGWDVGVSMMGYIAEDKIPNLNPQPGMPIVGVSATGLHSNGFTGARHVFFVPDVEYRDEWKPQYKGKFNPEDTPDILEGRSIIDAMIEPTALYLVEAALIGQQFDSRDIYGINITGNGFMNFNRTGEGVSFEITDPLPPLPIHLFLIQESRWDPETAYRKQNMNMGFAYVVPDLETAEAVVKMINERGENKAQIVGEVRASDKTELETTIHKPYEGDPVTFTGYTG